MMSFLSMFFGGSPYVPAQQASRILDLLAENEKLKAENGRLFAETLRASRAAEEAHQELRAWVANAETEGPKRTLEKANDAQAARAMARNTKAAFQVYQGAVRIILDRLDTLGQGNHVTKEDIRKLRQLRVDLGEQIGRSI